MFVSLRNKLVAICVAILIVAMGATTLTNFLTTRSRPLEALDSQMQQLARSHAGRLGEWVRGKRTVTSSIKLAADAADALPFIKMAQAAGGFDNAYIGYVDKSGSEEGLT